MGRGEGARPGHRWKGTGHMMPGAGPTEQNLLVTALGQTLDDFLRRTTGGPHRDLPQGLHAWNGKAHDVGSYWCLDVTRVLLVASFAFQPPATVSTLSPRTAGSMFLASMR